MFDEQVLNYPPEWMLDIHNFVNIFKMYDTTTIAKMMMAQRNIQEQQNTQNVVHADEKKVLELALNIKTLFMVKKGCETSAYAGIVYLKKNIDHVIDAYCALDDQKSKDTFVRFLHYAVFTNKEALQPVSDPVVLFSDHMAATKIESIDYLLHLIDLLRSQDKDAEINLRLVHCADQSVDIRLFLGNIESQFEDSFENMTKEMGQRLANLEEMSESLKEAFTITRKLVDSGRLEQALAIIHDCDNVLDALSQAVKKYDVY